ncbi:MAG TPA: hypothetical protein VJL81_06850 [Solirubrobacterales bacterium]|nr:hypothetical protein [Solirubrobacterales bacterium]
MDRTAALVATVVLSLVLLCGAGEALAADPIDLGPADSAGPGLALTAGGSAALTYAAEESPGVDTLHYCRIDPGAGGCSASAVLTSPLSEFKTDVANQPLVEGGVIRVLQTRAKGAAAEDHFLWSGEPFGAATTLGTTEGIPGAQLDFGAAVLAPAGTVNPTATVIATVGTGPSVAPILTATALTAASGPGSTFHFTTDSTSDATISAQGALLSLAYIDQTQGDAVLWRRYVGATGTPASIQSAAGWSAPLSIGEAIGGGDQVRMVTGPNGLYVAYVRPGDSAVVAQRYNGVTFEPQVAISPPGAERFAISEDSAGLLHLAYGGLDGFHYRYAKDATNTVFSNPQTLPEHAYREMRIVTTAAGDGWLTYWDNDNGHDFALPLAAGEPAPPSPPAPGGGGGTGGGGAPTRPTHPGGEGAPRAVTGSLGHGLVGELTTPRQCVPGGQIFKAKVAVKRKGSKAHKTAYTVKQVTFYLGKKKVATDNRKPFETSFATRGVGKGATLAVAAKISVILHVGHRHTTVSKTLKTTVTTCK